MQVPNEIEEAIKEREDAAYRFNHWDYIVSDFCQKHDIPLEDYDCFGGCESLVNPTDSAKRVRAAIAKA